MSDYPYTSRDLLKQPEQYFYSALQGPAFLAGYLDARRTALDAISRFPEEKKPTPLARYPEPGAKIIDTADLLTALEAVPNTDWLDQLVQRFEVTKRLYERYDWRVRKGQGATDDLSLYARLAAVLANASEGGYRLKYLNTLLKLNDLLCSQTPEQQARVSGAMRTALSGEIECLERMLQSRGISL